MQNPAGVSPTTTRTYREVRAEIQMWHNLNNPQHRHHAYGSVQQSYGAHNIANRNRQSSYQPFSFRLN